MGSEFGFDGTALYPEYWTDVNIALCPSDSRADFNWNGYSVGIESDFAGQIQKVNETPTPTVSGGNFPAQETKEPCLNALLSMPISYCYPAYAMRTNSQMIQVINVLYEYCYNLGTSALMGSNYSLLDSGAIQSMGCPDSWGAIVNPHGLSGKDLDALIVSTCGPNPGLTDDDGSPLPTQFYALREGVERFFITDINNPASSNMAQSEIFVMFDAWSNGAGTFFSGSGDTPAGRFNHIPGGSNVLFMDGHVEFRRLDAGAPMIMNPPSPDAAALLSQRAENLLALIGGWG